MGKAPYILVGSLLLCLALGAFTSPATWGEIWNLWRFLAVFIFGFIFGQIVRTSSSG